MNIVAEFFDVLLKSLLGLSGVIGLLALASPKAFAVVASYGGRRIQVGSQKSAKRWIDIDQYVIEHGRLFGLMIVASEGFIWSMANYGPESYSKSFLLVTVCIALLVTFLAVGHILRQKKEIESNLAEAHTDALTGLANRRAFDIELSRRLAQRQRVGTPLSLQIIDIDNFKSFNDKLGHLFGDAILKEISDSLLKEAREVDTVARLGGDEFAIILLGSNLVEASHAAERFRIAIGDRPIEYEGGTHRLTISSGVAEAQPDDDAPSLIKRADSALYAAKAAGRNCSFRHGGPELATTELATTDLAACEPTALPPATSFNLPPVDNVPSDGVTG